VLTVRRPRGFLEKSRCGGVKWTLVRRVLDWDEAAGEMIGHRMRDWEEGAGEGAWRHIRVMEWSKGTTAYAANRGGWVRPPWVPAGSGPG